MKFRQTYMVIVGIVMALTISRFSWATTIAYDNINWNNPNFLYDYYNGYYLGTGVQSGGGSFIAAQFTSNNDGIVSNIALGSWLNSGDNTVTISIWSSNTPSYYGAPGTIGSLLWSETFSDLVKSDGAPSYFDVITNGPELSTGSTYWLGLEPGSNSLMEWFPSNISTGNVEFTLYGTQYYVSAKTPAMRIEVNEVNPVPEPATMMLFGAGLVGLAGVGRKRFCPK